MFVYKEGNHFLNAEQLFQTKPGYQEWTWAIILYCFSFFYYWEGKKTLEFIGKVLLKQFENISQFLEEKDFLYKYLFNFKNTIKPHAYSD